MLLHFFSESLILMDWLLEIIFKDFKALRNFCKSVVNYRLLEKTAKFLLINTSGVGAVLKS